MSAFMSISHNLKPAILVSPSLHHSSSFPVLLSFKSPFSLTHPINLTRRLFLPSVSGIWDALTGANNNAREAVLAIRRGMSLFRQGDVSGSLVEFDKAMQLDPRQKACRSLAKGLDTLLPQSVWRGQAQLQCAASECIQWRLNWILFIVDLKRELSSFALMLRKIQMTRKSPYGAFCVKLHCMEWMKQGSDFLRQVGIDPRPVMREAYNMFKDGGDPEKFVAAFSGGRDSEYFYASLYAGLYYESQNETDAAKVHIVAACQSSYGQRSDDYMAALAKVHCLCRNWVFN
ncbi:hypothetical protein ACSQ67_015196 [Phaseolus vulgaris]